MEIRVLTLNVWGIPFISSHKSLRIDSIGVELCTSKYDIVSLQEVWSKADYKILRDKCQAILPYSYYFYSGVMGAGLMVLSKYPIIGALFHAWPVNGYFYKVQHADWFGGKGVGLCKILIGDSIVHLYNTHLHAEYDNSNDCYKTHRVIQAFDTAQFIEETRGDSVLQILAGDLNTQAEDITYKVLLHTSMMSDVCLTKINGTNECQSNSYTSKLSINNNPDGVRIDHIFVRSHHAYMTDVIDCNLPLPQRVPGQTFSFSDHEAVFVKIKLYRKQLNNALSDTIPKLLNNDSTKDYDSSDHETNDKFVAKNNKCDAFMTVSTELIATLQTSINLCDESLAKMQNNRIIYYGVAILLSLLLIAFVEYSTPCGHMIFYLLLKLTLFSAILFCLFMGSIWNGIECNGILSGKTSMEMKLRFSDSQPKELKKE